MVQGRTHYMLECIAMQVQDYYYFFFQQCKTFGLNGINALHFEMHLMVVKVQ